MANENNDNDTSELLEKEYEKIIEKCVEKSKKQSNRSSLIASIFYISFLLFIGLPIWFRTTTTERWPLPDISWLMVKSQTLTHYYKISIVFPESNHDWKFENIDLKNYLQSNYPKRISFDNSLSFRNDWIVRSAFEDESLAFKSISNESFNLNELDQLLSTHNIQSINSILFYVLPKTIKTDRFIHASKHRSYYLDLNHSNDICGQNDVVECLGEEINRYVQQIQLLVQRFYSHHSDKQEQNIVLLMARDFDFLFDIIYEEDYMDNNNLNLNDRKQRHRKLIKEINGLIEQFYTLRYSFSQYFRINFITQVLHYPFPTDDFIQTKLLKSNTTTERLLPLSSIDSILNRIETSRVEHDNDKSYHFVLYIRSQSMPDLKFIDEQNNNKSTLITTPFRGSILIVNDVNDLYTSFQRLIRSFLHLPSRCEIPGEFFTQLEIESVVHALIQKHILETLKSLESIEKLLNKVSNMVIEEKIAKLIHDSMEKSMKAADLLNSNGNIKEAYEMSWMGYSLSEQAFYHPSLLSLLYFPDDQKYAIYLPLFLPISIPLIHNIYHLFKMYKNHKKIEKK